MMEITEIKKVSNDGKDFLIIISKDNQSLFHSEIFEIKESISGEYHADKEKLIESAVERIEASSLITGIR